MLLLLLDRMPADDAMYELLVCGVPRLFIDDFELKSAGVPGDNGRLGVSITDPPEFKPVRIFIGLGSAFGSLGGEMFIIDPPDRPNRGCVSSDFGTILIAPPHICKRDDFAGSFMPNDELDVEMNGSGGYLFIRGRLLGGPSSEWLLTGVMETELELNELLTDEGDSDRVPKPCDSPRWLPSNFAKSFRKLALYGSTSRVLPSRGPGDGNAASINCFVI